MKPLVTEKTLKERLGAGEPLASIVKGSLLTPSAKDYIRELDGTSPAASGKGTAATASPTPPEPVVPNYEYKWVAGADPKTPEEIQAFFTSPEIETIKRRMVNIGWRMWNREYTDGNGGNLTVRVGDNLALCTPTLVSKGFMKPEDICLVDLDGKQLAGIFKRTSEALTHFGIMKRVPEAKACCHAHPPHATAFAVAKVKPPTCLIPEAEVFLGQIGMAEYRTPGTPDNADVVGEAAASGHMSVLMLNHGVITYGKDIEDAYWKMENTESYCKTIWIASQLGNELTPISGKQAKELIELRKSLGMKDYRETWKECELCDNSEFRPGTQCIVPVKKPAKSAPSANGSAASEVESLVQRITDEIMRQLEAGAKG